jgi:hypothetical protein
VVIKESARPQSKRSRARVGLLSKVGPLCHQCDRMRFSKSRQKCSPTHFLYVRVKTQIFLWKSRPKIWEIFVMFDKIPIVNTRPSSDDLSNLVTLLSTYHFLVAEPTNERAWCRHEKLAQTKKDEMQEKG